MHHMNPPTLKPVPQLDDKPIRVTVPVSREVLEAFQELAAVTGTSTGKAMGEWLGDTIEGVHSMQKLLSKAREAPKQAAREMNAYALGLVDLSQELIESVMKKGYKVPSGDDGVLRQRPPAASGGKPKAVTPPSSNTGGKPTVKAHKRAGK